MRQSGMLMRQDYVLTVDYSQWATLLTTDCLQLRTCRPDTVADYPLQLSAEKYTREGMLFEYVSPPVLEEHMSGMRVRENA